MRILPIAFAAVALALAAPAMAGHGKGGDKGPHDDHSAADHAPGKKGKNKGKNKDKGEHGRPEFSRHEQDEIAAYFRLYPEQRSQLPPGLAKRGKVPPGWQKKLARGQRIPDDIWVHRVPLPRDILIRLPPPPPGVVIFRIHDRVVRVVEKTHELLDEFGLPHPPTPPRLPR